MLVFVKGAMVRRLFPQDDIAQQKIFQEWVEFSNERFVPMDYKKLHQESFNAAANGTTIGGLDITEIFFDELMLESTPSTVRNPLNKPDMIVFGIKISGECILNQFDRTVKQEAGDISIIDANAPFGFAHLTPTHHLVIQIPRERLEKFLGPAKNFSALSMRSSASAELVSSFFRELIHIHDKLSPDSSRRMASIGVDLIVASVAERMAQTVPRSLRPTIAIQKAKRFIESNLSDVDLNSQQIAGAAGISLRQLQTYFGEQGQHISDWLWKRRLEVAAERLADPGLKHLTISTLCEACGFLNQTHFTRRFKDKFGVSPGEFRRNRVFASKD